MSFLGRIRREFGYQGSTPVCRTCTNFKESRVVLTKNSNTVRLNHHCNLGGFNISPNGCCDRWAGKDGSKLKEQS